MSFIGGFILGSAAIGAGASLYGAYTQSQAEQQAQQQLANQQGMTLSTIQKYLQPYTTFGASNIPTLESLLQPGPNQNQTLSNLPGFQFAEQTGSAAVANAGTTRGMGGNVGAAEEQFGTGLAQGYWGNYIQQLLSATGIGAQAAGTGVQGTVGTNTAFAPAIAQTTIGQANALAGGAGGVAGAAGSGVNTALNYALLSKLAPGSIGQYANQPVPLQPTNASG